MKRFVYLGMIGSLLVTLLLLAVGCSDLLGPSSKTSEQSTAPVQLLQRLPPTSKAAPPPPEPEPTLYLYREQSIVELGGTLTVGDNYTGPNTIIVPEGALTQETLITMSVPVYGDVEAEFGPDGTVFGVPCTVELSYLNAELLVPEEELYAVYWNEETEEWEYVGGVVDTDRKVVIFEVEHFSRYGLAPR